MPGILLLYNLNAQVRNGACDFRRVVSGSIIDYNDIKVFEGLIRNAGECGG